jgi:hypothetical protein
MSGALLLNSDSVTVMQDTRRPIADGLSDIRKCALSSALFRRVEVPLALK